MIAVIVSREDHYRYRNYFYRVLVVNSNPAIIEDQESISARRHLETINLAVF